MENKLNTKRILFIALCFLAVCIVALTLLNAFFIWQLYFRTPQPQSPSTEELVMQTLTAISFAQEAVPSSTLTQTPETSTETIELPTQTETVTLTPEPVDTFYQVKQGDTLEEIARSFGVGDKELRAKNNMLGDFLLPGQTLIIPPKGQTYSQQVIYSVIDPEGSYNLVTEIVEEDELLGFSFYMEENGFAYQSREQITQLALSAFNFVSSRYGNDSQQSISIYVASGPFNPQYPIRSAVWEDSNIFVLHDGSGNLADLNFQLTYAAGLYWVDNVLGGTQDNLLREGFALSLADEANLGSKNLELCDVSWAYQEMDQLPSITSEDFSWNTWPLSMVELATVGCYYRYLSENYGADLLAQLFASVDYSLLEGETFEDEEELFHVWLNDYQSSQTMDLPLFVEQMDRLLMMNNVFFPDFDSWEEKTEIYYGLDNARLVLWQNNVMLAKMRMTTAGGMLGIDEPVTPLPQQPTLTMEGPDITKITITPGTPDPNN